MIISDFMNKTHRISALFFGLSITLLLMPAISMAQTYRGKVSVDAFYQIYQKGSLFNAKSTSLYDGETGKIISHYLSPKEFYKTINQKGETTIYTPDDNTVTFLQNSQYSSSNELLYYFVNNQTQDMGLKHEGFSQTDTRREDNYIITTWQAPPAMKAVSSVELVSENFLPVYAQYFNHKGKILKKIYYYNYYKSSRFCLPRKITEITYTADNDSTVRRTTYSDIQTGDDLDDQLFNFKIPEDAEKIDF